MEINKNRRPVNKLRPLYFWGISIILCLPILTWSPLFFPPDWGKAIVFRVIMSVLLFAFCYQFLYQKEQLNRQKIKDVIKNKVAWLVFALLLIYFVASIFSVDPLFSFWGSPLRSGGVVNFVFYIFFAFLVLFVSEKEDYKKYATCALSMGVFISLLALTQYYGFFKNFIASKADRPSATIGNPIFFGIYLLLMIFLSVAFAIEEKNKYKKIFYTASSIIFFISIIISGSRACWASLLLGIIFFLFFYPSKKKWIKGAIMVILIVACCYVAYSNTINKYPQFLENNKIFHSVNSRVSIKAFFQDARFPAWEAGVKAVLDKPVLGYGIENFYVGFDKYFFSDIGAEWWDRAHNILIQTAADAGIPAAIIYLAIFGVLLWQLQKQKKTENALLCLALQTTLLCYFIANFFSIDCFPTYMLFYFIISFAVATCLLENPENSTTANFNRKQWHKPIFVVVGGLVTIIFLWQYNLLPLIVVERANEASSYVDQKKCDNALTELEDQLSKHSFVDAYIRLKYVNALSVCAGYYPDKNLEYANKGIPLLKEAGEIQPLYSRTWLSLGGFLTSVANSETNPTKKAELVKEALYYFDKAEALTPGHQTILIERIKLDLVLGNLEQAVKDSEKCIILGENYGECYWVKAAAEIRLNQNSKAEEDLAIAFSKGFEPKDVNYYELIEAYTPQENYVKLAWVYEKLIEKNTTVAEYHSSLAYMYYKLGEYQKAREQALEFARLMPEAQDEVDAFLKLLPN